MSHTASIAHGAQTEVSYFEQFGERTNSFRVKQNTVVLTTVTAALYILSIKWALKETQKKGMLD
jgi:hypothetical protein